MHSLLSTQNSLWYFVCKWSLVSTFQSSKSSPPASVLRSRRQFDEGTARHRSACYNIPLNAVHQLQYNDRLQTVNFCYEMTPQGNIRGGEAGNLGRIWKSSFWWRQTIIHYAELCCHHCPIYCPLSVDKKNNSQSSTLPASLIQIVFSTWKFWKLWQLVNYWLLSTGIWKWSYYLDWTKSVVSIAYNNESMFCSDEN